MSNNHQENRSYLTAFILFSIIMLPIVGIAFVVELGAIGVIFKVLVGVFVVLSVIFFVGNAITNKNEAENFSRDAAVTGEVFSKLSISAVAILGFILACWFAIPMFYDSMQKDADRTCGSAEPKSLQKVICDMKK